MYNPRQNQGRRKDQVESSEKILRISSCVIIGVMILLVIRELINQCIC
jgi:hypothetical protein